MLFLLNGSQLFAYDHRGYCVSRGLISINPMSKGHTELASTGLARILAYIYKFSIDRHTLAALSGTEMCWLPSPLGRADVRCGWPSITHARRLLWLRAQHLAGGPLPSPAPFVP